MKIGIIGAGKIALDFLSVVKDINEIKVQGISATKRSEEKLKQLQEEYNIENIYTDYKELLKDNIEVVYIATPNVMHYEMAKEALNKNKSVLLEKPFTSNYKEAKELIDLANKKGLIIFEAISNQYLPNYLKTKELLKDIGKVKIIQTNFSQYSSRYDDLKKGIVHPVFDVKQSGGTLVDLNLYNIYFILGLFGQPEAVYYTANIENEVDTSGILIMEYKDFKAVSISSKDCDGMVSVSIQGEDGYIYSTSKTNTYENFKIKLNNKEEEFQLNGSVNRLYYEILEFYEIVKNKDLKKAKIYNEKTLAVMKILDESRRQIGIKIVNDDIIV